MPSLTTPTPRRELSRRPVCAGSIARRTHSTGRWEQWRREQRPAFAPYWLGALEPATVLNSCASISRPKSSTDLCAARQPSECRRRSAGTGWPRKLIDATDLQIALIDFLRYSSQHWPKVGQKSAGAARVMEQLDAEFP
jgi:hypothetical protein